MSQSYGVCGSACGRGCLRFPVETVKVRSPPLPLSSECGTYKTVKARLWPWLSRKKYLNPAAFQSQQLINLLVRVNNQPTCFSESTINQLSNKMAPIARAHIKGVVEALELRLNKMRPQDVDKMKVRALTPLPRIQSS